MVQKLLVVYTSGKSTVTGNLLQNSLPLTNITLCSLHASAIQVLGAKPDDDSSKQLGAAQTARPVWETAKDAIQYGSRGHGSGFFFTEKPDANVWVDGEVANYFRETYEEVKERLGEVRALRLAGHNTMFPTLSWLNGTGNTARMASTWSKQN